MLMTVDELKKAVRFAYSALLGNLIVLGTSANIFSAINDGINSTDRIATKYNYRNKEILEKYLDTLVKYHILEEENGEYILTGSFLNKIDNEELKISKITEDFTTYASALMRFFNHYLIDRNHPYVTTSFINDSDVWGLWLENRWFKLSREVIASECKIGKGEALLDVGCGSSSPVYYGKLVGPYGRVLGIDKSEGLIDVAEKRIKKLGYGWISVKKSNIEQSCIFKEKYDIAVLADVLQYVRNIKKVLCTIDTAIKRNGKIIIFTPCFADSKEEYVPMMEFINAHVKDYVNNVSREEVEKELGRLGYEVQEVSEKSMLLMAQKL